MVLPEFEIQETVQDTLQEIIPVEISGVTEQKGRGEQLDDAKINETPTFVEDDAIIISHDDAKPEDVAEAEAAVKVTSPVQDRGIEDVAIVSFLDGPAELLLSCPAESNVEGQGFVGREDIPAETAVSGGIYQESYEKVDASDFGVPSLSDSHVHLGIKTTSSALEPVESAESSVGAFNIDGAAVDEDVRDITEAAEDLTSTSSEAVPKADSPSITGELAYLWSPFQEMSNKFTAENDSDSTGVTLEEPTEEKAEEESIPDQTKAEPCLFIDRSASELSEFDPTTSIITASVLGGAAVIGAAAIIAHSSSSKLTSTAVDNKTRSKSIGEDFEEPMVSKQVNEESIMEPAPQTAPSPVHGIVVPEADVKQALEDANTTEAPAIVVSSPPTLPIVGTSREAERTAEVIEPTPGGSTQRGAERESGEIFSHPVWNQSITPFLHFSLENTASGLKKRPLLGSMAGSRPVSSGNDTVSTKHQKNMMRAFWNVIFFGWLGGFGRILSGMFGKSKKAQRNAI